MHTMRRLLTMGVLLLAATMTTAQAPERRDKGKRDAPPGGPPGGPPRFVLGRVLPPFAVDQLDLTADQKAEIDKLEKDVKARLEKILNADQRKKLETLRPRFGPGGRRPGGPDAPPPPEGQPRPEKKRDKRDKDK